MVRATIREASELKRKEFIPDSDRTPDRDDCADWIETNIVDGDMEWPETSISQIAAETNYSREHVARTLDRYFDPAGATGSPVPITEVVLGDLDVDESSDDLVEGIKIGLKIARENPELFE